MLETSTPSRALLILLFSQAFTPAELLRVLPRGSYLENPQKFHFSASVLPNFCGDGAEWVCALWIEDISVWKGSGAASRDAASLCDTHTSLGHLPVPRAAGPSPPAPAPAPGMAQPWLPSPGQGKPSSLPRHKASL